MVQAVEQIMVVVEEQVDFVVLLEQLVVEVL